MKLIKIGRATSCGICINQPTVSSLHAELLILDDGRMFIEDKNSTNGTFVGGQRIPSGVETEIRRGDLVQFGNMALNWSQVPAPAKNAAFKRVINIGSNYRNDMVITDPYVSRYHAVVKIGKDNKAYINDLGSRNGTSVNGVKITPGKDFRIRKGDTVSLGNKDITDDLNPVIPGGMRWLKWVGISVASVAVIFGIVFAVYSIFFKQKYLPWPPEQARTAVVYVDATYQLYAKLDDCPIHEDIWEAAMKSVFPSVSYGGPGALPAGSPRRYSATAFFIDRYGRMATNRHVASPWELEYLPSDERESIKTEVDQLVTDQQLPGNIYSMETVMLYSARAQIEPENSVFWNMILTQAREELNAGRIGGSEKEFCQYLNSLIRQFRKCKVELIGKMEHILVGYPGRNYTHMDEFARCNVVAVSPSDDADVAILQLNDKKTPADVVRVFEPKDFYTGKLKTDDQLVWIGYPRGSSWALDENTKSLEPTIKQTSCSKMPSKYTFEINGETLPGSSGSPVYMPSTGQLVGIVYGINRGASTYGHACLAKYIKKLYDEEVYIDDDPVEKGK